MINKKITIYILLFLSTFSLILTLSKKYYTKTINEKNINYTQIAVNSNNWKKKVSRIKRTEYITSHTSYINFPTTLNELKDKNSSVIKGKIIDLGEIKGAKNIALTKVTIIPTEIISGDDELLNKPIKILMKGGITTNKDLYFGMEEKIKQQGAKIKLDNEKVMVRDPNIELPEIGSEIITGIIPNKSDTPNVEYNEYLESNDLGGEDSYSISVPEYNVWLKTRANDKFNINNKELNEPNTSKTYTKYAINNNAKKSITQKLNETTDEINNKFNEKN